MRRTPGRQPLTSDDYVARIESQVRLRVPDNIAQTPLSMMKEGDEWFVFLHIKEKYKGEYETQTRGNTLLNALRAMNREAYRLDINWLRYQAANEMMGIPHDNSLLAGT